LRAPGEIVDPNARVKSGPFRAQLLKWIGNKQKQADAIIAHFPSVFGTYYEPFLGSGGILGVLSPPRAVASDGFLPLIEIWRSLLQDKQQLKQDYADRYALIAGLGKHKAYARVQRSYNSAPNGANTGPPNAKASANAGTTTNATTTPHSLSPT